MLRTSRELRSAPFVIAAYIFAPLVAVSLLLLVIAVPYVASGRYTLAFVTETWGIMAAGSVAFGVPLELIIVTPILLAYRLFHWPWPNIWIAGGIGVLILEGLGQLGSLLGFDHHHYWFGWRAVLQGVAVNGFVGLTAAMAFHLIAIHSRAIEATSVAGNAPTPV